MKIFGSSKKSNVSPYTINGVPRSELESVTNVLLKFCNEHGLADTSPKIDLIKSSVLAIEKSDVEAAKRYYEDIGIFQKEGFYEWYPEINYPDETREYVSVIFQSLVKRWAQLMLKIFNYES